MSWLFPILGNTLATLVGQPGITFENVRQFLADPAYREHLLAKKNDPYLVEFWNEIYPTYPKGSHLPIINRLDQFLRPLPLRKALCTGPSSFSIREALATKKILLFDLSGLSPGNMLLMGQLLLAKFQLELMRRETFPQKQRLPFYLYADEFQTCASVSETTWQELLSRGRRYGLALTLANQYPSQLPKMLQDEIFGNVASLVTFGVGAKDAQVVRRELLITDKVGKLQPIPPGTLTNQKTGQAIAKLGSGAQAIPISTLLPIPEQPLNLSLAMRDHSWKRFRTSINSNPSKKVPKSEDPIFDPNDVWQ